MAIFKKTATVNFEALQEKLCKKCIISAADLLASRQEIIDLAQKAVDDYVDAAQEYLDRIVKGVTTRNAALEAQKSELQGKVAEAEGRLGSALINDNQTQVDAVEAEIAGLNAQIDRVDERIRIFKGVVVEPSGAEFSALEEKHKVMLYTISRCNKMLDAVNDTSEKHIQGFRDVSRKLYGGFPSNITGYSGLVDNNYPKELKIESLRSLTFDKHTINEVLDAVEAQDSFVFYKD